MVLHIICSYTNILSLFFHRIFLSTFYRFFPIRNHKLRTDIHWNRKTQLRREEFTHVLMMLRDFLSISSMCLCVSQLFLLISISFPMLFAFVQWHNVNHPLWSCSFYNRINRINRNKKNSKIFSLLLLVGPISSTIVIYENSLCKLSTRAHAHAHAHNVVRQWNSFCGTFAVFAVCSKKNPLC